MDRIIREQYFMDLEEEYLLGGASFSEWCTYISESVYTAFVNGADLATVITSVCCIETYLRTESSQNGKESLAELINKDPFLLEDEKEQLHTLRKYRNRWVHAGEISDIIFEDHEEEIRRKTKEMAYLSVKLLLKVLFSNPYV